MAATSSQQISHQDLTLQTVDGLSLPAFVDAPPTPRGVVVLAHGYAEHSGRYAHVFEALMARGFAVAAITHRGHGACAGRRASIRRFDLFVEDFSLIVIHARRAFPGLPLFVLGHSMGGLIAVRYALHHQQNLTGLIVSGPALIVGDQVPAWQTRLLKGLSLLAPDLALLPRERDLLSRNPDVEHRFVADPLCYAGRVRLGLARELYLAGQDACAHLHELSLPILIMHGAADRVTSPRGSELLYREARSPDKTLKLWPDDRHEIFNELDGPEVIAFMCDWLAERESSDIRALSRARGRDITDADD